MHAHIYILFWKLNWNEKQEKEIFTWATCYYWSVWAIVVLVNEVVAITDKEWRDQAALTLPASMNWTDMMTEIDLTEYQNGSESEKNDSIKNELKEWIVCHFFLYLPILCPPLPAQINPKAITWGQARWVSVVGVWSHGRGMKRTNE